MLTKDNEMPIALGSVSFLVPIENPDDSINRQTYERMNRNKLMTLVGPQGDIIMKRHAHDAAPCVSIMHIHA